MTIRIADKNKTEPVVVEGIVDEGFVLHHADDVLDRRPDISSDQQLL